MSIQWMDNFIPYGTGPSDIGQSGAARTLIGQGTPYVSLNSWTIADPLVSGGVALQVAGTNNNGNQGDNLFAIPVPGLAIGVACRFYLPTLGPNNDLIQWQDVSQNVFYSLDVQANGALAIYTTHGGAGSLLVSTVVPVVTAAAWWHIEAMVDLQAGNISVFVEGVRVINQTIATSATDISLLGWSPRWDFQGDAVYQVMKDFIVYDKEGSVNNSAGSIGPVTVYRLSLDRDVSNGWTITGGSTVFGTIGEEPPVDAQFIAAGLDPFPAAAICGVTPLPSNIVGVRGVMTLQRVGKSDGGDAEYNTQITSGSSVHTSASHSPSTSFAYAFDVVELDPATGELWSPVAVNNSEPGLNRTV